MPTVVYSTSFPETAHFYTCMLSKCCNFIFSLHQKISNILFFSFPPEVGKGTYAPDAAKKRQLRACVPFSTPSRLRSDQPTPTVRLHPRSSPTDLQRLQMLPHEGVGGAG